LESDATIKAAFGANNDRRQDQARSETNVFRSDQNVSTTPLAMA
jgi:hypothetical protein